MIQRKKFLLGLAIFFLLSRTVFAAQELTYDRYAPVYEQTKTSGGPATHFLVYPFELVRWPVDKALFLTEKYDVTKKALWIYDRLQDQGITPELGAGGLLSAGVTLDFLRLTKQKVKHPDLTFKGWTRFSHENYFEAGTKIGAERIINTPFRSFGLLNYQNRPQEHFYGIGPNTSRGEGTSFRIETTDLESIFGYSGDPSMGLDLKAAYKRVNITNGTDGGRGIIDNIFPAGSIPGLDGDQLFILETEFVRDTRNHQESSTRGSQVKLSASFNEGLWGSAARYFKYKADASKFIRLGSERRILAMRFYGEYNSEAAGHYVPFHQMAKLGGHDSFTSLSNTLRGFGNNRFFDKAAALLNIEYRYTIWEYGDWKTDAVLFWDEGQVFDRLARFKFNDFRESYGVGFRTSLLNHLILTVELAHGDEGTRVYVKTSAPF